MISKSYFYFSFVKNSVHTSLAYRADILLTLFFRVLRLVLQISFWNGVFYEIKQYSTFQGEISLQDMIVYSVVSSVMTLIIDNDIIDQLEKKVRTGEIATDLIKPVNLKACLFCDLVGQKSSITLFLLLPYLTIGMIIVGGHFPCWQNLLLSLIAIGNGVVIFFLLTYLVGLLSFWFFSVGHLKMLLNALMAVLSGSMVPLWFFPKFLYDVSHFLPFKSVYFVPLSIFMEKVPLSEVGWVMTQQILWIGILWGGSYFLWNISIKRLVVQGG